MTSKLSLQLRFVNNEHKVGAKKVVDNLSNTTTSKDTLINL